MNVSGIVGISDGQGGDLWCGSFGRRFMKKFVSEDVQFRVLRLLENQAHLSQREMAAELALSLGGINYCLKALVEKGQVKIHNFRKSNSKIGYAYLLTPSGLEKKSRMAASFLRRKLQEYEALRREIDNLERELGSKSSRN